MINAGKIAGVLELDTSKFKSALKGAQLDLKNFQDKSRSTEERIGSLGGAATKLGSTLNKSVTVPLLGIIGTCTTMAATFEDKMTKVSTISDETKVPIDSLKRSILDLSSKTGTSTSDLAEGLYELYSAGVDTAEGMEYLEVANKAAVGGFTDLGTSVDGLTTIMNSFGLQGKDALEQVANQMLICQNLGKTTFGELAQSLGDVTPVAASVGMSTAELFSTLASTTSQGLQTSKSVTALKAALSNIIKPSNEAAEAAKALGIDFSVSALKSKGWIGFMKDVKKGLENASPQFAELSDKIAKNSSRMLELEKAGKKNTNEYKLLKTATKDFIKEQELLVQANDSSIGGFATLFGSVEGLNAMLMLTSDQGMELYNESMKQMGENTSALDDAFNKMDATEAQAFKKALNEFKIASIELGREFLPLATDIAKILREWVGKFKDLSPEQKEFIAKAALMLVALGPILSISGNILKIFQTLSKMKFSNLSNLGQQFGKIFGKNFGKKVAEKAGTEFATEFASQAATKGAVTKALSSGAAKTAGSVAGSAAGAAFASGFAGAVAVGGIIVGTGAAVYAVGKTAYDVATKPEIGPVDLYAPKTVGNPQMGTQDEKYKGQQYTPDVVVISEATKKVVEEYMKIDDALSKNLDLVRFKAPSVTQETFDEITRQMNELNETIKTKINENFVIESGYMTQLLSTNKNLTDEQKKEVLKTMDGTKEGKLKKLQEMQEKEKTYNQQLRSDNEEDQRAGFEGLLGLQEEYSTLFLENSGATAGERAVIESRLNEYRKNATAETAIEILDMANTEKEEAIKKADEKYAGTINALESSGLKEKNGALYDELKRQAEDEHKKAVDEAEGKYDDTCTEIEDGSADVAKAIDFSNRRIKTPLDRWKENLWGSLDSVQRKVSLTLQSLKNLVTFDFDGLVKSETLKQFDRVENGTIGYNGYGLLPGYATGTSYASRGLHIVGEDGPEIIAFRGGERVYNTTQTKEMLNSSSRVQENSSNIALINEVRSLKQELSKQRGNTNVNITTPNPLSEYEIYRQMERLQTDMALGYI